jgi:hypothetical protein
MRALVVAPGPNFSVADVYRGWAEGLAALGVETRLFELDTLLQEHQLQLRRRVEQLRNEKLRQHSDWADKNQANG